MTDPGDKKRLDDIERYLILEHIYDPDNFIANIIEVEEIIERMKDRSNA